MLLRNSAIYAYPVGTVTQGEEFLDYAYPSEHPDLKESDKKGTGRVVTGPWVCVCVCVCLGVIG